MAGERKGGRASVWRAVNNLKHAAPGMTATQTLPLSTAVAALEKVVGKAEEWIR